MLLFFFLAGIKFYLYLDFANFSLLLKILDEMKNSGVKPNGQTYICLLNACAAAGRLDPVYVISPWFASFLLFHLDHHAQSLNLITLFI